MPGLAGTLLVGTKLGVTCLLMSLVSTKKEPPEHKQEQAVGFYHSSKYIFRSIKTSVKHYMHKGKKYNAQMQKDLGVSMHSFLNTRHSITCKKTLHYSGLH